MLRCRGSTTPLGCWQCLHIIFVLTVVETWPSFQIRKGFCKGALVGPWGFVGCPWELPGHPQGVLQQYDARAQCFLRRKVTRALVPTGTQRISTVRSHNAPEIKDLHQSERKKEFGLSIPPRPQTREENISPVYLKKTQYDHVRIR